MNQTETKSLYISSSVANIPLEGRFLFGLGLFFLISSLLSIITGRGQLDIYSIALSIFLMFFGTREFFNIRRNHGQPFIVLGAEYFRLGWPGISIPYAAVEYFVFDQSQTRRTKVAFSLFPKPGTITDIKGSSPVKMKEGRIVCRPVKLDGSTARAFFEDFNSRLIAAGAVNAMTDPESVAGINSTTGEALIEPKKPLSSWLIKIGTFTNMDPCDLKWVSFRLGSLSTIYLVFSILSIMKDFSQLDFNLVESILNAIIMVPFIAVIPIACLQEVFIHYFGRVPGIANFIEKTGEMKKLLLGASVGAAIYLSLILGFLSLVTNLR